MSSGHMLFSVPIAKRPPLSWHQSFTALLFCILFIFACFMVHGSQIAFLLPLKTLRFRWSKGLYDEGICFTKGSFGCLLVLMGQWFAPTELVITFETQGKGKLTEEEISRYLVRDKKGSVISLDLPTKFVLIANHQVYADWWYAWCFTYFMSPWSVHRYVYITLKNSLRWVPVIGWGMQFYDFIFLARSWASDRLQLAKHLSVLGKTAEQDDTPFCFILYPEGTLVSENTRPISTKFADKIGISDMKNVLLPRSTGLHYSLRSLAPKIPDLKLLDLTFIYHGVPPLAYGQDYYTLRSMFLAGTPPPRINIHVRLFDVSEHVPIGSPSMPLGTKSELVELDIPSQEKNIFDSWLRDLWREKDESMTRFYESGSFDMGQSTGTLPVINIPMQLRNKREILDAFCFFFPAGVVYLFGKMIQ